MVNVSCEEEGFPFVTVLNVFCILGMFSVCAVSYFKLK